jgi:hypothetical protein
LLLMPYDFYIPTDPVDWTRATLNEDGTLVVHDYDLDPDIALVALGGDPSLVMDVMKYWEDDPILFLCGKAHAIPIKDCGIAAWAWATESVRRRQDDFYQHPALRAELDKALGVAFSALTKSRMPFKRLIVSKREVSDMISRHAELSLRQAGQDAHGRRHDRGASAPGRHHPDGPEDVEYFGYPSNFDHFCDVAVSTSKAIRHGSKVKELWEEEIQYVDDVGPLLIELAVSKMGEVQRARGGL